MCEEDIELAKQLAPSASGGLFNCQYYLEVHLEHEGATIG